MRLSPHNRQTAAAAVPTVSHNPQRYAAAARTNTKKRKNGLPWPVVKVEISAGQTTSAA